MSFTSGKISQDPMPWLHDHRAEWCSDNGDRMATNNGVDNIYSPRPEFDNHNPILAGFRDALDSGEYDTAWLAAHWAALIKQKYQFREDVGSHTQAHRNHARRVLSKLAALA